MRDSFLTVINNISEDSGMGKNDVWNEFISKALDESAISSDDRKIPLCNFFSQKYSEREFSVDQLDIDDLVYFGGF